MEACGHAHDRRGRFLTELGRTFLGLEDLDDGWEQKLTDCLKTTRFLTAINRSVLPPG
jgi:hypothetical protein